VDQVILLVVVFVEQEMQLIERRAGNLPVMLLVQITERHRVGQKLIQVLYAFFACLLRQCDRHPHEMSKWLNLVGLLVNERRGAFQDGLGFKGGFRHVRASSAASKTIS